MWVKECPINPKWKLNRISSVRRSQLWFPPLHPQWLHQADREERGEGICEHKVEMALVRNELSWQIDLKNKYWAKVAGSTAVVVGRSKIVGTPVSGEFFLETYFIHFLFCWDY